MTTLTLTDSILGALVAGSEQPAEGGVVAEFVFPAADPVFAGHFPGRPLLPGVFQIEMARVVLERALGVGLRMAGVERAKFLRPILPGERVRLELKTSPGPAEGGEGTMMARASFSVGAQPAGELSLRLTRDARA